MIRIAITAAAFDAVSARQPGAYSGVILRMVPLRFGAAGMLIRRRSLSSGR
jgi:hypothetical protein